MEFQDILPEDGRWARPLLVEHNSCSCEYAFLNVFMWKDVYNTQIARYKDFLIARSEGQHKSRYLFPSGHGNLKEAIDAVILDASKRQRTPVLFALTLDDMKWLQENYPNRFLYTMPREESDYVYSAQELAELPGKKFQKKRNHCSRFERSYPDWSFHEITPDVVSDISAFNIRWRNLYDNRGEQGILEEHRAIEHVLLHYDELQLKGGYLTTSGEIVAFSFGSPLNENMFVTHVEKALYDLSGAYNMINREMARCFCKGYTYINRENDLGEEGLRTAKLSYQPLWLEDKYTAEFIIGS